MRAEKAMSLLRLCYYNLKSLKLLYFVPIAVLFLLLPFFSVGHYLSSGLSRKAFELTFMEMQRYIPFMATWWVVFGLREYAEGDGRELLRVYKNSLLGDFFLIFFWYILHAVVLISVYAIFFENFWMDFLLFFIQSFVFAGSTFFLMLLCRTIAIPFLINVFYEIFCIYSNVEALRFINMVCNGRIGRFETLLLPYLPLLVFSFILIFSGNWIYKKRFSLK